MFRKGTFIASKACSQDWTGYFPASFTNIVEDL